MFKYLYITIGLLLFSVSVFSQEKFILSGKITTDSHKTISEAEIILLNQKDSTVLKYAVLSSGSFQFDPVNAGNFILQVKIKGFHDFSQEVTLTANKSIIVPIKESEIALQEVHIVGAQRTFVNKNGDIKVNVANSILASTSNSLDLVSKLPGLQISSDQESITVIGKGSPLIYIDNQKMTVNDLKSLSVNDIKSIEIINNPSAKYEAEGRAVILITRKQNKNEGYEIALSENASLKSHFNNYSGINASFKKKKLEFKANFQYNQLQPRESNGFDFNIADKNIQSSYLATSVSKKPQFLFGGGIFYQINEDDYLLVNSNARTLRETFPIYTDSYQNANNVKNNIFTTNANDQTGLAYNGNINYVKKLKDIDGQLFFGGQYSSYRQEISSRIANQYLGDTTLNSSQNRYQKYHIDVITGRVDFEKKFGSQTKFEAGTNISSARANATLNYQNYRPDEQYQSYYDYTENNYAAYSQLSGKLGKVSYSAGLRVENTKVDGGFNTAGSPLINKNYTYLFPKANIDLPIDSVKTLSLSYSRNIVRPNYSDASSITTYINPFLEFARNTNLNPTLTNELAANLQVNQVSLRLSYYWYNNPVYYSFIYDDAQNRLTMFPDNFNKESGVNLNLTVPLKFGFWSSTNTLTGTINKIQDPAAVIRSSKPSLYYYSDNSFKLPDDFSFSVQGWGLTKRNEGIFERNPLFVMNLAVTKKIAKKLDCTLSFNDIFKAMNFTDKFTINNINTVGTYYGDVREVALSLKYSFGHIKNSTYKEKQVDENSGRIR